MRAPLRKSPPKIDTDDRPSSAGPPWSGQGGDHRQQLILFWNQFIKHLDLNLHFLRHVPRIEIVYCQYFGGTFGGLVGRGVAMIYSKEIGWLYWGEKIEKISGEGWPCHGYYVPPPGIL